MEPWMLAVWEAMYRLEPWGDDWVQTAHVVAEIRNKDNPDKVNPYDLIPNEDNRQSQEEPTAAEVHAQARSFVGL